MIDNSSTKLDHLMNASSNDAMDVAVDGEFINTIISLTELQDVTLDTKGNNIEEIKTSTAKKIYL